MYREQRLLNSRYISRLGDSISIPSVPHIILLILQTISSISELWITVLYLLIIFLLIYLSSYRPHYFCCVALLHFILYLHVMSAIMLIYVSCRLFNSFFFSKTGWHRFKKPLNLVRRYYCFCRAHGKYHRFYGKD